MSSFELNKFLGAILGTCLFVVALNITAGALFAPEAPVKPGYNIVVEEQPKAGSQPAAQEQPFETVLASANPERGVNGAKLCGACHTFNKGGANGIGPNLYGVVGRPRASEPGFNYSPAMKAKGGTWTFDDLNQFLIKPQAFVPGTAMSFPGYPRANQRADVIAYLNTLADSPKPLPKAAAAPTAAPATPAAALTPTSPAPPAAAAPAPAVSGTGTATGAGAKPAAPNAASAGSKPSAAVPSTPPTTSTGPKPGGPANPEAKSTGPARTPKP